MLDMHAEYTSEKLAMLYAFDGRANAIFGTHTHVQTADEQVFGGGTGYITDVGMCGPHDSVLGVKSDIIIRKFLMKMPVHHEEAEGDVSLCGCIFTVSTDNYKTVKTERVRWD